MTPTATRVAHEDLQATLERLLSAGDSHDAGTFLELLDSLTPGLAASTEPMRVAWRHALAARRALIDDDAAAAAREVGAAREVLDRCPPSADTALAMAYLAHVEVTADRVDAAMLLAIDASLLVEQQPPDTAGAQPSWALHQAHRWLSLTLSALDLEELAVEHALRASEVAAALPPLADRWRLLRLAAHQHVELAQTLHRRGRVGQAYDLSGIAIRCATEARELGWHPDDRSQDLLDVVQAWALICRGELDDAQGPLRRTRRRVQAEGDPWLRGFTDLALARLLARLAARDRDGDTGEEAVQLLVDAAGAFVASGDRRRYRQCLLELGQQTADLGRPAEAMHWLEAYRADTGRVHTRRRELWAEMFVRRSRLREAERQAALLRRHALEDPLTGLGNRRCAERRLGALRLGEEPLALAVVDVDRFKEINDDTSHSHGDAVLRRVADLLREHSRTGDEVYRWAGDEFLVVLPTATESQAVGVMERLRAAVAGANWRELQLPEPVTVSIGVACAPAGRSAPSGWRGLFDTADLHLFAAKRGGRNRVRAPGRGAEPDVDAEPDEDAEPNHVAEPSGDAGPDRDGAA